MNTHTHTQKITWQSVLIYILSRDKQYKNMYETFYTRTDIVTWIILWFSFFFSFQWIQFLLIFCWYDICLSLIVQMSTFILLIWLLFLLKKLCINGQWQIEMNRKNKSPFHENESPVVPIIKSRRLCYLGHVRSRNILD